MQALEFIFNHLGAILGVIGVGGGGVAARQYLKAQAIKLLTQIAEHAAEDALALLRRGGVKLSSLLHVWEIRVREALADHGITVTHEQAVEMRRAATRKAQQYFISHAVPEFAHAVTEFDKSFHDNLRKLEFADAALRRRADETLATRVDKSGGP